MKKLMIVVAALFAVVSMSSAVDLKWGAQMTALDDKGNSLDGGAAYLVYLGGNGRIDMVWNDSANRWDMGDDEIVSSATIIPAPASSSSTGMFTGTLKTTNPVGSLYQIMVTSDGVKGTALPTTGYYGFSPVYDQKKGGAMDTENMNATNAGFSTIAADTPVGVPEPTTYALVGLAAAALALRKRFLKK